MAATAKLLGKTVIFFFLSLLEEVELLEMKRVLRDPSQFLTILIEVNIKVKYQAGVFFPHRQNMKTRLEYCPK